MSCHVTLCPAGVQAETGKGDAGKKGAQVPHPEPPRPLPPAQRHRGSGPAALGRRPLLHWLRGRHAASPSTFPRPSVFNPTIQLQFDSWDSLAEDMRPTAERKGTLYRDSVSLQTSPALQQGFHSTSFKEKKRLMVWFCLFFTLWTLGNTTNGGRMEQRQA